MEYMVKSDSFVMGCVAGLDEESERQVLAASRLTTTYRRYL
jgi:hypothetical protein